MSTLVLRRPAPGAAMRLGSGSGPAIYGFMIGEDGFVPAGMAIPRSLREVVCHLRMANLKTDDAKGGPRLVLGYALLRGDDVVASQVAPYVPNGPMDPDVGVPVHFRIPVGALPPGSYTVLVQARDERAPKRAVRGELAFDVLPE